MWCDCGCVRASVAVPGSEGTIPGHFKVTGAASHF